VKKVAVAGATGRTGSLVVEELLDRGVPTVALVRDEKKALEKFPDYASLPNLEVVKCDLSKEDDIAKSLQGCDAVIWCATGFSDAETSIVERLKRLMGIAMAPSQSIDSIGIPTIASCMLKQSDGSTMNDSYPKLVMLSSAGVTRPQWDDDKKARFPGSANIPIVRLNPFGILNVKAESEEKLRKSGVPYSIVRPAGLKDKWPTGSRLIFSQGDVAAGRIHRKDVATLLVDVLSEPDACGKTFEVLALAGYPPPISLKPSLSRLKLDSEGLPSIQEIEASYHVLQQLLPGERQDSAALAMGQTYEQLDKGEMGRLGKRGEENAEKAAPKPTAASLR
jgi:uncharacterized protein YbjT (DUF2867 family)